MPENQITYRIDVQDQGLRRGQARLKRFTKQGTADFKRLDKQALAHNRTIQRLTRGVGGLVSAYIGLHGVRAFVRLTDQATNLNNQIKAATRATGEFTQVSEELKDVSNETLTPLRTSVALYREVARLRPELQATLEQELVFVRAINQAAQISGASTTQVSDALRQLSQGLAAGILRAEEWNSVVENTPEIAAQIAAGFDTTVGQLRKMVIEGKVLSKDVFQAMQDRAEAIEAVFMTMERTFSQNVVVMHNAALELAAAFNEATGFGEALNSVVQNITASMRFLTSALERFTKQREEAQLRARAEEIVLGEDRTITIRGITMPRGAPSAEEEKKIQRAIALLRERGQVIADNKKAEQERIKTAGLIDTEAMAARDKMLAKESDALLRTNQLQQEINLGKIQSAERTNAQLYALENQRLQNDQLTEAQRTEIVAEAEAMRGQIRAAQARKWDEEQQAQLKQDKEMVKQRRLLNASNTANALGGFQQLAEFAGQYSIDMFYLSKRLGQAQAAINTAVAVTRAVAELGPIAGKIAAAGLIASGAAQIAIIEAQQPPTRRMGGAVAAGRLYEVGESGPEILRSGGRNYMLPGQNGAVLPNHQMTPTIQVNITNNAGVAVDAAATPLGVDLTIGEQRSIAEENSL